MSANEIRARLMELARERLEGECMRACSDGEHAALALVTELAVLHGQLYGRNLG